MTSTSDHTVLRPPVAELGCRQGVRRSRIVFTERRLRATGLRGVSRPFVGEVVAVVDNPVRVAAPKVQDVLSEIDGASFRDDAYSEAGTLGFRFADGSRAHIRLAEWWHGDLDRRARGQVVDTVVARLDLRVERAVAEDVNAPLWQPAADLDQVSLWLSRVGPIVVALPLLMALGIGTAEKVAGVSRSAQLAALWMFPLAAALGAVVSVSVAALWLWRLRQEGPVRPEDEFVPDPAGATTRWFRRTARLQWVDGELRLVNSKGYEVWLGGSDDDFGVVEVRSGVGYRYEEPDRPALHLLDRDGRSLATLDQGDWCASPASLSQLTAWCAKHGVSFDPAFLKRARSVYALFGDTPFLIRPSLPRAGIAGAGLLRVAGLPLILAVAVGSRVFTDGDSEPGRTAFGLTFLFGLLGWAILGVPAVIRMVRHRILLKQAARA